MRFTRLHDPSMQVLFENDEIIAVDKPYGISSHTNDSKAGNEGYIQQGLIELYESQLTRKLHIVHRLDRTTTGVIGFAKSLEAAAKFQGYFRNRETQKTYVFVTRSQIAATELASSEPITVKGTALEAETSFRRLSRKGAFDIWQASPRTGRNHQIRIHAAGLGIPLLGDTLYGGTHYPFICLHNKSIQFPENLLIESRVPAFFDCVDEEWFASLLFDLDRRERVFGASVPLRLSQGFDLYGDVVAGEGGSAKSFARLAEVIKKDLIVHRKDGWISEDETPLAQTTWTVRENEIAYEIRASVGASLGLPLDQRLTRAWIREHAKDRDVLNLVAGNCTASVAASVGGAKSVTSVELKKSALDWGRANFALNPAPAQEPKFLCRDPLTFIHQAAEKKTQFDLIVCEVPSFLRREKGVFKVEGDLESLLTDGLKCLKTDGDLLFSTTSTMLKLDDIRKIIERAAKSAGGRRIELANLLPSLDVALPGEAHSLKTFLVTKKS